MRERLSSKRQWRSRAAAIVALLVVSGAIVVVEPPVAHAAAGDISTVAGDGNLATAGDGGAATAASLASPYGLAAVSGGFYVSQNGTDAQSSRVRIVTGGAISTVAGGADPPLADGAPATEAALASPEDVIRSPEGDLYIADFSHSRIRKVTAATDVMTTVAGSTVCTVPVGLCQGATSGDGGLATAAQLNKPSGLALDSAGDLYVSTVGDFDAVTGAGINRVRRIDAVTGIITTVAGGGTPADGVGDGGPAASAQLSYPRSIAIDSHNNLFIADLDGNRIRKVDAATGIISTVAGTGSPGLSGDGGPATSAQLFVSSGVAVDSSGDIFIADEGNFRIRKVDAATGTISTMAGTGTGGYQGGGLSGDGGPATSAKMYLPTRVSLDAVGDVFIDDAANYRVRMVNTAGIISTVAGNGTFGSSGDGGPATAAAVIPDGGTDATGNLLIPDSFSMRIREVDSAGIISTVAGGGVGDGYPATQASLAGPRGLATDGAGDLIIADCGDQRVRKVDASGVMSTIAGATSPTGLGDGGPATAAELQCPSGVAVHAGSVYIADADANRVRRVDASGVITTVAGTGVAGHGGDGRAATAAQLSGPTGLGFDSAGDLFIADTGNDRIRRVDADGRITTVAGNGAGGVGIDGVPATSAAVTFPTGVTFDSAGNLVIAESGFARIRRVDASGIITTIAGTGIPGYSGDSGPATVATLDRPTQLAYDSAGNLLFTDQDNERVRSIAPGAPPPPPIATRKTADCGRTVAKSLTLATDIGPCPGDGLVIGADGVNLNLNGHMIFGDSSRAGTHAGVRVQGHTKVKVRNGTITGFDAGVAIIGGSRNTATGLTITNNLGSPDTTSSIFGDGVVIFFSAGNAVIGNAIVNDGPFDDVGVLGVGSDSNLIKNNMVKGVDNEGDPYGPVGIGIIVNPYLGADRPRDLSLKANDVIDNQVVGNGNAGISSLSNLNGVIQGNRVVANGLENPYGGPATPGNGIGVQNLMFASPTTSDLVESNTVIGNGADGIQVLSNGNRIIDNISSGNGGSGGGLYYFDLHDLNSNPVTFAPTCGRNVWSGNVWGSAGYSPKCTSADGHVLSGAGAIALGEEILSLQRTTDPPARRAP